MQLLSRRLHIITVSLGHKKKTYMEPHVPTMNMGKKNNILYKEFLPVMPSYCQQTTTTLKILPSFSSLFMLPFALRCSSFTTQP